MEMNYWQTYEDFQGRHFGGMEFAPDMSYLRPGIELLKFDGATFCKEYDPCLGFAKTAFLLLFFLRFCRMVEFVSGGVKIS